MKKILMILLSVSVILAISACTDNNEETNGSLSEDSSDIAESVNTETNNGTISSGAAVTEERTEPDTDESENETEIETEIGEFEETDEWAGPSIDA